MNHDLARTIGETTSLSVIVATFAGWLPSFVALLALGWYCVLFYDRFKKKGKKDESDVS